MKHETVRTTAFAMPLTNPAFPSGPYIGAAMMRWSPLTNLDR
jgi:acetoacetate decarboxylase